MQVLRRADQKIAAGHDHRRHARTLAEGRAGKNRVFRAGGKHDQRAGFAETVDLAVRAGGRGVKDFANAQAALPELPAVVRLETRQRLAVAVQDDRRPW